MSEVKEKKIHRATLGRSFADWDFDREHFYYETQMGKDVRKLQRMWSIYKGFGMHPAVVQYWAERGILKEEYDADIFDGKCRWTVFTPMDIDYSKKYPMIYVCHGGGEDNYQAETYGYAHLVNKEKLICVCANNGLMGPNGDNQYVSMEFPRILGQLIIKGYPIDLSRIYAVGFSSGSDACDTLATAYPEILAGVGPCPGPNSFKNAYEYEDAGIYEKAAKYKIPIICVAGKDDVEDHFPFDYPWSYENYAIWINDIAGVEHFKPISFDESRALIEESDNIVEQKFGLTFDNTYTKEMEGTTWYFGEYTRYDGNVGAKMVLADGKPHIHVGSDAPIIWDFLKHFSRDPETHKSIYTENM